MAFGFVSPVAIQQFFDANGHPLSGGKLSFYLAGTDTPTPAYADYGLTVPLPNPVVLNGGGWAPELFLGALSYKQVLQSAAGVVIWTADNLTTPAALRSTSGSISLTGSQSNVPVPTGVVTFLEFRNTAPLTIDGFAGGTPGQVLILRALGTAPVHLLPAHTSASATGNQLIQFVGSGPTSLAPAVAAGGAGTAMYFYLTPWWILISHEQGGWLPFNYAALTFTSTDGTGPVGTWVVEPADALQAHYRLQGSNLLVSLAIDGATITGGTAIHLRVGGLPYAWKTATNGLPGTTLNGNTLPYETLLVGCAYGAAELVMARGNTQPWTAVTNTHRLFFQGSFDVA